MKIAISGAGIAGPTLAYWLRRGGHEPTLIEKSPTLRTAGYMIDFWGRGFEVAERMGLASPVRQAGYLVRRLRYVDDRGSISGEASTDVITKRLGDRFCSLSRGDLAALLYGKIEPEAECLFGASIVGFDEDAAGVLVRLDDGSARMFDLLVGADGVHSKVRQLALGSADAERPLGYHVAAFEVDGYSPREEPTYVSYGLPGRQISKFAERNGRTLFLLVFESERLDGAAPEGDAAHRRALEYVFRDAQWEWPSIRRALEGAEDVYFDRVVQVEIPTWSRGRVALVGDAAACISLLGGEGAGLAMIEAYVLAGELSDCQGDFSLAFSRYEARLRGFVEAKQRSARQFARSFAPHTALGVWIRNKVVQLMNIPGVAALAVGKQLADDICLPAYSFSAPPPRIRQAPANRNSRQS